MSDNTRRSFFWWRSTKSSSKTTKVKGMSWVLSNESVSWPGKSNVAQNLMSETKQAE